jgi:hypothetical protein
MDAAAVAVVGSVLPITQTSSSPLVFPEGEIRLDYIWRRQIPRCDGYLGRLGVVG